MKSYYIRRQEWLDLINALKSEAIVKNRTYLIKKIRNHLKLIPLLKDEEVNQKAIH